MSFSQPSPFPHLNCPYLSFPSLHPMAQCWLPIPFFSFTSSSLSHTATYTNYASPPHTFLILLPFLCLQSKYWSGKKLMCCFDIGRKYESCWVGTWCTAFNFSQPVDQQGCCWLNLRCWRHGVAVSTPSVATGSLSLPPTLMVYSASLDCHLIFQRKSLALLSPLWDRSHTAFSCAPRRQVSSSCIPLPEITNQFHNYTKVLQIFNAHHLGQQLFIIYVKMNDMMNSMKSYHISSWLG